MPARTGAIEFPRCVDPGERITSGIDAHEIGVVQIAGVEDVEQLVKLQVARVQPGPRDGKYCPPPIDRAEGVSPVDGAGNDRVGLRPGEERQQQVGGHQGQVPGHDQHALPTRRLESAGKIAQWAGRAPDVGHPAARGVGRWVATDPQHLFEEGREQPRDPGRGRDSVRPSADRVARHSLGVSPDQQRSRDPLNAPAPGPDRVQNPGSEESKNAGSST